MPKRSNTAKSVLLTAILCLGMPTLMACDEKGPAEKAGEKVDESVQDAKRAIEDATD